MRIKAQAAALPGADIAQTNRDDRALAHARGAFGRAKFEAVNDRWLVKGMVTPLIHHQLDAAVG